MKKFDTIYKKTVEDIADDVLKTNLSFQDTIKRLKQIRTFSKLSDEEFDILEKANNIMIKALENIEDDLEEE